MFVVLQSMSFINVIQKIILARPFWGSAWNYNDHDMQVDLTLVRL